MHGAIQPWCEIGLAVGVFMAIFIRSVRRGRSSIVLPAPLPIFCGRCFGLVFVLADSAQHEAQGHRAAHQQTRMVPQDAEQKDDRRDGANAPTRFPVG